MNVGEEIRSLLNSGQLNLPLPGSGATPERHQRLAEFGKRDLSLARLVEGHLDAVAILAEAGRQPVEGSLYAVWASESTAHSLELKADRTLLGSKAFCSGATIVDRALVAVAQPDPLLLEIDLRHHAVRITIDSSEWTAAAFSDSGTATVCFSSVPIRADQTIGAPGWYLTRPGFWNGACGPAACWAGGAEGLWEFCATHPRENPHDLANLGAIYALTWALSAALHRAGIEIDQNPFDCVAAQKRALALRHSVDAGCAEILRLFLHTYGPRLLAFNAGMTKRCHELELYTRQCHAGKDLAILGHLARREASRESQGSSPSA